MMLTSLDHITIASSLCGFGIYLLLHFFIFRSVTAKTVLIWLMRTFIFGMAATAIFFLLFVRSTGFPILFLLAGFCVSLFIYGLLSFFFVLYVFGPFETSIRMRLLYELYKAYPEGMDAQQLLSRYNAATILETRLERFLGSGEIYLDGSKYQYGKPKMIFLALEYVSGALGKLTKNKN